MRSRVVAPWLKEHDTTPDDQSLILGSHVAEGEKMIFAQLSSNLHTHAPGYVSPPKKINSIKMKIIYFDYFKFYVFACTWVCVCECRSLQRHWMPWSQSYRKCEGPCGCWEQNSARLREISVPNCSASAYKRKGQFRSYKDAASLVLSSQTFLLSKPLCFLAASEGSTPSLDQYSWFLLAPVHVCKVKVQFCTESVLYKLACAPCQVFFLPSMRQYFIIVLPDAGSHPMRN